MEPIPIRSKSEAVVYDLLLTAIAPISHHDPAVQDGSNESLYNRRKQRLPRVIYGGGRIGQPALERFSEEWPMPVEVAECLRGMPFQFVAGCALIRAFLDEWNSREGCGLFAGQERYSRLDSRSAHAAMRAPDLPRFWSCLCDSLQVTAASADTAGRLVRLCGLPRGVQAGALRAIADEHTAITTIARVWHTQEKCRDAGYAAQSGQEQVTDFERLVFDADQVDVGSEIDVIAEVPTAVSANSLRHEVVREPGMLHLFGALGLRPGVPGHAEVPPGVEALFYNGGNIREGGREPAGASVAKELIRHNYPLLDLLSGCVSDYNLEESRLKVFSTLVCRENEAALRETPASDLPALQLSAFDLIDHETFTRQAGRIGLHQMIVNQEVLCTGAQMLLRLVLDPFTPCLTEGALMAAVTSYLARVPTVAGMPARGYGFVRADWLAVPSGAVDSAGLYEDYLDENRDRLAAGLRDGTLGTGSVVVL